ncbi:MAG TPA: hypothetical protein VIC87_14620 [Vicinamibacteria bacterium]|jgi:hypothetical protein
MDSLLLFTLVYGGAGLVLLLLVLLSRRARRHGGSFRAGVIGALYEWQNKDKQNALDVIVEGRAAETRPESPDGDLPQLESPKGRNEPRRARAERSGSGPRDGRERR